MKQLHEIRSRTTQLFWMYAVGLRYRRLTPYMHVYEVERGEPPPRTEGRRAYWIPYANPLNRHLPNVMNPFMPICGSIKTRSGHVTTEFAIGNDWWRAKPQCPDCLVLVRGRGVYHGDVIRLDPWTAMSTTRRMNEADPVSGA